MAHSRRSADQILLARFEEFFRDNYERVSLYVARRVPRAGVDDVVSASFIVAWKKFATIESPSLPWLFRIASYEVSNQRRTTRRSDGILTLEDAGDTTKISGASEFDGSEVIAALHRLSENDQEILRLTHWEGLSRSEVAQALVITTNAATVRHHRALQRLTEQMMPTTTFEISVPPFQDLNDSTAPKEVLP
jgi:RNA polymerase sigma-70 factor (ECF subfamily)